jgi:transposase InsO family protein
MEALQDQFPLDALADALEVSPSGFEGHRQKPLRPRAQQDEQLRPIITESFIQSLSSYGSPRIQRDLRALGRRCGTNRISRLMREQGLRAKQKRRFRPMTTQSSHGLPPAENWLAKVPAPDRPGQIWQSDITYIETAEGWLYLAFTLDACSRRCLAYHCGDELSAELVLTTFRRALRTAPPVAGLIHHSDRGIQYASAAFQRQLASRSITPSMSRKANPYDNALAESFVATLKTECFGGFIPPSKAVARLMLFQYIEGFYNPRRRHSALDYRSPLQFEQEMFPPNRNHQLN